MAHNLHDFLRERAEADLGILQWISHFAEEDRTCRIFKESTLRYFNDDPSPFLPSLTDPDAQPVLPSAFLLMHPETISRIRATGFVMAGEAAKHLARECPELIERNPDFPWGNLKRVRDLCSHPARSLPDPAKHENVGKQLQKESAKLFQALDACDCTLVAHGESANRNTSILQDGLRIASAMLAFENPAQKDKPIILRNSAGGLHPALRSVAHDMKIVEGYAPVLMARLYQRTLLMELADLIENASCFYQRDTTSPLDKENTRKILAARHMVAHLKDMHGHLPQSSLLDEVHLPVERLADNLRACLPAGESETEAFTERLAQRYMAQVLGKYAEREDAVRMMDDFVGHLAESKVNSALTNGYVLAAGKLIQQVGTRRAGEVLDYLALHPKEMRSPPLLLAGMQDCPHGLRPSLRDFIGVVKNYAGPAKSGLPR